MPATDPTPDRRHAPPSTILVVDDSPVNLQVIVRTLDGHGHRVLAARDGRAAITIAQRARPDLILLDVMMPGLDGFGVCRALKEHPDTRESAVIFLSARDEVADKVSGLELGAVDYVTKPIQAGELLARISSQLTRRSLERALRQSRDRLERELAGAASMQRLLLPAVLPPIAASAVAAFYQTSRHAGGDYYDVLDLGGDRFGVMVADVSGHGAPAAIVMAMIRAVVHTYPGVPDDPPAVLHYLNEHFRYLWDSAMFATALYGVYDARRRTWRASCAGHPPPLLTHADGRVETLIIDAVPALLWSAYDRIPCIEHPLAAGDRLVLFTDGILDRESPDETMYDVDRLVAALSRLAGESVSGVVQGIVDDLERFAGGHEPGDDQTIVVVGVD